jgi:tetratricopeptide (TPR) repeat protein
MVMVKIVVLLLVLLGTPMALGQSADFANRDEALAALVSPDADRRAAAVTWIASHGTQSDSPVLRQRLVDESVYVRGLAENGLWMLWSHSGDAAIDALLAKGVEAMQDQDLDQAITTFSEVIRRRPDFAEGWNKRATALFLAGEFRKSLADCDEVMKRNPDHFGALAGYGQNYFQLEQYGKAIDYWKRALQVNPNMTSLVASIELAERLIAERRQHSA